jgi:hypothetical protein
MTRKSSSALTTHDRRKQRSAGRPSRRSVNALYCVPYMSSTGRTALTTPTSMQRETTRRPSTRPRPHI